MTFEARPRDDSTQRSLVECSEITPLSESERAWAVEKHVAMRELEKISLASSTGRLNPWVVVPHGPP
jgi:hypothetical protein